MQAALTANAHGWLLQRPDPIQAGSFQASGGERPAYVAASLSPTQPSRPTRFARRRHRQGRSVSQCSGRRDSAWRDWTTQRTKAPPRAGSPPFPSWRLPGSLGLANERAGSVRAPCVSSPQQGRRQRRQEKWGAIEHPQTPACSAGKKASDMERPPGGRSSHSDQGWRGRGGASMLTGLARLKFPSSRPSGGRGW